MPHETWQHRADGIMTLLGYTLGPGAIMKFPYMIARNGGGAYLIPYVLCVFLCGLPVYYLEIVVGQFFQKGAIDVWNLSPAFKGLGFVVCLVAWVYITYSSMWFSWFMFYFYNTFQAVLPWSTCSNSWNTDNCVSQAIAENYTKTIPANASVPGFVNVTGNITVIRRTSSVEEFWRRKTLAISDGLHDMGEIQWSTVGCVAVMFAVFYLCIFKDIRIRGKIVYVTVLLPMILITVLLVRGCLLPGSLDGIIFFIKPNFSSLANPEIWIESCIQSLYSLGVAGGVVITSASHNHYNYNCLRQAVILCIADVAVNIYAGFATFAVLGHVAKVKGQTLDDFKSSGYDIAFITFPETLSYLPLPQAWAAVFFLTLLTLGIDTSIPCLEVVITAVGDRFPKLEKRRWLLVLVILVPTFLLSFSYTLQGGMYLLTLVDWFILGPPVMLVAFLQTVALCWVFGISQLDQCSLKMYGQRIPAILKGLQLYITPVVLLAAFVYTMYGYRPPKYGSYIYPGWAGVLGWMIAATVMLPLPLCCVYAVWRSTGATFNQKLLNALRPRDESVEINLESSSHQAAKLTKA